MISDTDFLLEVLKQFDGMWVSQAVILQRSADRRGCGMTAHSRASDLRKRGLNIECKVQRGWNERTQRHDGRAVSYYKLGVEEPNSPSSAPQAENGPSHHDRFLGDNASTSVEADGASSTPTHAAASDSPCTPPAPAAATLFDMPEVPSWA